MKTDMKIAIVGAGPTGLAAALFLAEAGFNPTIFERFDAPKAIGSGLMIQPTGLSCLADLGLSEAAIEHSARIEGIYGDTPKGKVIFDIPYDVLGGTSFALGMHRGVLFDVLFEKLSSLNLAVETSHRIVDCLQSDQEAWLLREDATEIGPFDLVIDASGTGSVLRQMHGDFKRDKTYEFGALWGVCETDALDIEQSALIQRYVDAKIMIGLLPLGSAFSATGGKQTAFFWSLKLEEYDDWLNSPFENWQQQVASIWPKAKPYVDQFSNHGQLTLASYHDTALKTYSKGRLVFIGDAAHATSPQLGQGANMGLMDARRLAKSLTRLDELLDALKDYENNRKKQVRFYQMMSHYLTPFFQSDSKVLSTIRDLTFHPMSKLPFMSELMMQTLAGVKTGPFSSLKKI